MKHIKIPVYNQDLYIFDNYDDPDRYAIVESAPLSLRYNKESWCLSILAHECVHVVNFMLANIGQGMPQRDCQGYYDDEFYSYLYAAVYELVFNKTKKDLKEFRKEPKKKCRKSNTLKHLGVETAEHLSPSSIN